MNKLLLGGIAIVLALAIASCGGNKSMPPITAGTGLSGQLVQGSGQ